MTRSAKDTKGYMLISAVGVLAIALFIAKALSGGDNPGPDNCVGTPTANTVIVLDQTEQISDQTLDEIRVRALDYAITRASENERVSVFTVSDLSKKSLKPVVSLCRPRDTGNRMVENVAVMRQHFKTNYTEPLTAALSVPPASSHESPIAQALVDLSLTKYLRGKKNTLVVFSDMLENTSAFSLYSCALPDSVIPAFRRSRLGATERPTFVNTYVVLNLIPRLEQTPATLRCRDKLWLWFFGDSKGDSAGLQVDYLPGGASMGAASQRGAR